MNDNNDTLPEPVNPRLRPEDIHAGMTGGGTPAPSNAELLRLADALEGR